MCNQPLWHFDVLPFRPPPFPDECISGYLLRLAQANGFPRLWSLVQRVYPDWKSETLRIGVLRWEYPVKNCGLLPQLTALPFGALKTLTVAPLIEKFLGAGFTTTSAVVPGVLLRGAVNPMLRICPLCLSSEPYVRLLWRFENVTLCVRHQCLLVERCQRCGRLLTSADSRQRHLQCASCSADLRLFTPTPVSAQACAAQATHLINLRSMLQPNAVETHDALPDTGCKFRYLRHLRNMPATDLARTAGIDETQIFEIEQGRSASIARRLKVLAALEATWLDLAQLVIPADFIVSLKEKRHASLRRCPEPGCVNAAIAAAVRPIHGVRMIRDEPSHLLVRFHCASCGRRFTRRYSGELCFRQDCIKRAQCLSPEHAAQLPRLKRLALLGLTQVDIAHQLGWGAATVRVGLMTLGILVEAKQAQIRRRRTTEFHKLKIQNTSSLVKANAALARLNRKPAIFHWDDVARESGIPVHQLRKFPNITRRVLSAMRHHNAFLVRHHRANTQRKLARIIQSLSKSKTLSTLSAVASQCGAPVSQLRRWHPDLLSQLRLVFRQNRQLSRKLRRQHIIRQIDTAAQALATSGARLSGPAILRAAGLSRHIKSSDYVRVALQRWVGNFAPRD